MWKCYLTKWSTSPCLDSLFRSLFRQFLRSFLSLGHYYRSADGRRRATFCLCAVSVLFSLFAFLLPRADSFPFPSIPSSRPSPFSNWTFAKWKEAKSHNSAAEQKKQSDRWLHQTKMSQKLTGSNLLSKSRNRISHRGVAGNSTSDGRDRPQGEVGRSSHRFFEAIPSQLPLHWFRSGIHPGKYCNSHTLYISFINAYLWGSSRGWQ